MTDHRVELCVPKCSKSYRWYSSLKILIFNSVSAMRNEEQHWIGIKRCFYDSSGLPRPIIIEHLHILFVTEMLFIIHPSNKNFNDGGILQNYDSIHDIYRRISKKGFVSTWKTFRNKIKFVEIGHSFVKGCKH